MIKVNLIEKKKSFQAPVVLGFDFTDFPLKLVIITLIFTRLPLTYLESYFTDKKNESNEIMTSLRKKESDLRKEIRKNNKIAEQLKEYNKQIEDLKKRGKQVDVILQTRTNPRYLLESLARLTPKDLWLELLNITDDKKVKITGSADNYRSIGNFIKSLNETPYFDKSLQLKDSKTKSERIGKRDFQFENFVIEGRVESFNPFIEEKN